MTDSGAQFYASEKEEKLKGLTVLEYQMEQDVRHVLSRVNHPQTGSKVERFSGTLEMKLPVFLGDVDGLVNLSGTTSRDVACL